MAAISPSGDTPEKKPGDVIPDAVDNDLESASSSDSEMDSFSHESASPGDLECRESPGSGPLAAANSTAVCLFESDEKSAWDALESKRRHRKTTTSQSTAAAAGAGGDVELEALLGAEANAAPLEKKKENEAGTGTPSGDGGARGGAEEDPERAGVGRQKPASSDSVGDGGKRGAEGTEKLLPPPARRSCCCCRRLLCCRCRCRCFSGCWQRLNRFLCPAKPRRKPRETQPLLNRASTRQHLEISLQAVTISWLLMSCALIFCTREGVKRNDILSRITAGSVIGFFIGFIIICVVPIMKVFGLRGETVAKIQIPLMELYLVIFPCAVGLLATNAYSQLNLIRWELLNSILYILCTAAVVVCPIGTIIGMCMFIHKTRKHYVLSNMPLMTSISSTLRKPMAWASVGSVVFVLWLTTIFVSIMMLPFALILKSTSRLQAQNYASASLPVEGKADCKIMICGWKKSFKVTELGDVLASKLGRPITLSDQKEFGNRCFLSVPTEADAKSLQTLTPLPFRGEMLKIVALVKKPPPGRVLEMALHAYVTRSYNSEAKFLDLSSLKTKIDVTTMDLNLSTTYSTLWKVLLRCAPQIESLSFSGNNIHSLSGFDHYEATKLRDLKNFCFSNNAISEMVQVNHLKRLRVRELDFRQNPIFGLQNYKMEVEKKFPQLRFLDGAEVKMLRSFVLPGYIVTGTSELPAQITDYSDCEDTRRTASQFLTMFFEKFDQERGDLRDAYTDQSFFSMSMLGEKRFQDTFRASNRNLLRLNDSSDRQSSLLRFGKQEIQQFIGSMPTTAHHLNECSFDSYVIQSMPGVILLCIQCYGRLSMNENSYSFSRTFLLAPNKSGVAQTLWPVVILNDQLHLEDFVRLLVPRKRNERAEILAALMKQTRLLEVYATQCLESTQWNYDEALAAFQSRMSAGAIPPAAFQQP
ncbi:TAP Cterminal subfamily protein [Pelomyxa schiedti]|nr:TAP Cterminal subfamily protein [Pelomyxa schiedti]